MKNIAGKTALVTGGSSGIGLEIAKQMAAMGSNIWLMARNADRLAKACQEVSAARLNPDQKVLVQSADVSKQDQVHSAIAAFRQQSAGPDIVVNSAGDTYPGEFEKLNLQIYHDLMDAHYFGTLNVVKEVVPGMIERNIGMIINISSLVGIHGLYGYSAYSPAKFAVVGLSDVLRYELMPHGIQLSVAFPSDTKTPQLDFENSIKPPILKALSESNTKVSSAAETARSILKDALKGKYMIFPSNDSKFWYFMYRLFPGDSMYKMVDGLMVQARRKAAQYDHKH